MSTFRWLMIANSIAMCLLMLAVPACEQTPDAGASETLEADNIATTPHAPLSDQESAQVAALLADGDAAYQSGNWLAACDTYSRALTIDPANTQARAGLDASLARLDRAGGLNDAAKYMDLLGTAAIAEFDAGYQRSLQALENDQLELAKGAILQARATLLKGRICMSVENFESRDAKAAELLASIDRVWELRVRSGG